MLVVVDGLDKLWMHYFIILLEWWRVKWMN